jgi:osmoprotectant transport system permease protein
MLISPKRANDKALLDALRPLAGAIDVALMRDANLRASAPGASATGAAHWLWAQIGQRRATKK